MNNLLNFFDKLELQQLEKSDSYTKAEKIVERLFEGKTDKGGNPYLNHLYYVSNHLEEINMKIVGLLHDLLEDTIITADDLKEVGFNSKIIEALLLITKMDDESYEDYINRVLDSNNLTAINVKKVDMEHNMDLSRITNPTSRDYKRLEKKYKPQYKKITNYLKEEENKYDRY